jgi:4-hydroxy-tetrahydrodipicolinate synthase
MGESMFRGSFVALVTPMTEQEEIDWDAFGNLIEWQIEEGTDGLVLGGSTGEGAVLTSAEKLALFKRGLEIARGRVPIFVGSGGNSTKPSLELTREAKALGASGALIVTPYYNRPGETGCLAHYSMLAKADLPLILYYNPARTAVKLSPDGIARICEIPQVVAVKDASGDLSFSIQLMQKVEKPIFSGDDVLAFPHLSIGFKGVISIVGNIIPHQWGNFVRDPTCEAFFQL